MSGTSRNLFIRVFSCLMMNLLIFELGLKTANATESVRSMFTCDNPCQDVTESSRQSNSIPCTITYDCNSDLIRQVVPNENGPVAANGLVVSYHNRTGPDDLVYLAVRAEWNISETRIELLRGYVFRLQLRTGGGPEKCLTVTFNRTLTSNDAMSKFSLDCLYGNFTRPEQRYAALVRTLPVPDENGHIEEDINMPNCEEVPEVALCKVDNYNNWNPDWNPTLEQLNNGTVKVTFWPDRVQEKFPEYEVVLTKYHPLPRTHMLQYIVVNRDRKPIALYDNVTEGVYRATISIKDCNDCVRYMTPYLTVNAIVTRRPPTSKARTTRTVKSKTKNPQLWESTSPEDDSQLSLAAVAGALGGFLGLILFIVVLYLSCKWKISLQRQSSEDLHKDPYADDGLSDTFLGIDNPSMIPQTIHSDMTKASDYYAHVIGHGKGDSISSIAVDIHSCGNGHLVYKGLPSPESQLDSGFETLPEIAEDSSESQTVVLSLALPEPLGEMV